YSLHIWDVAAAALIIREAGGIVTDWNGGDGWPFGQRLVAGNLTIHTYLLNNIKEIVPAESRNNVG
ncbi:MAG: inositol monophosphatase family protein, partial [Balneolaceae bacterium]